MASERTDLSALVEEARATARDYRNLPPGRPLTADLLDRLADALSLSAPAGGRDAIIEECAKLCEGEVPYELLRPVYVEARESHRVMTSRATQDCHPGDDFEWHLIRALGKYFASSIRALKSGDPTWSPSMTNLEMSAQ